MTGQLPLHIELRPSATFANFVVGENQEAYDAVKAMADGGGEPYLYLWGREGTGKTHLAQAACHLAHGRNEPVSYVPLAQHRDLAPEILADLEQLSLVCIDDVHRVIGLRSWELALFNLYNRLRERGGRLLVTADGPQRQLQPQLADLSSRLSWGPGYQLHALRDDGLLAGLTRLAAERGLELQSDTGRYLLNRCPRDMKSLLSLLEQLDRASLAAQRRLTIPFVKEVLQQASGNGIGSGEQD